MVPMPEIATGGVLWKKRVLKNQPNYAGKNLCWSLLLIKSPTQVFSCEICEIFKNIYFEEHLQTNASATWKEYWGVIGLKTESYEGIKKPFLKIS